MMRPHVSTPPLLVLLLLAADGHCQPGEPEPHLGLLVPAYFYPAGAGIKHWDRLIAASAKVPILAIVNPDSGPGKTADPAYAKLLDRATKHKGLTLLGYVSTRYGKRPMAEVQSDVDRWLKFYPQIQGIFFDEQASGADGVDYYAALYRYARKQRKIPRVVTNPGTICVEPYLARPATDAACLFESDKGFPGFRPPAWSKKYQPARFAMLAYQVADAEQARRFVTAAVEKGIGHLYVTDAAGANPWDRLPAYWDEEVEAVRKVNSRKSR